MSEIRLYSLPEVMDILKLTRRTLYNYIKNNQLKAVKIGRTWRVREEDLIELTKTGTRNKGKPGRKPKEPQDDQQ